MEPIVYRGACLVIGYIFGIFQTAYIYGRLNNIDIRDYGSGNAGTTNAMRVLGKKAGFITYFGDAFKGIICGIVIRILFSSIIGVDDAYVFLLLLYAGLGVVLGHNYPFYMGFKGGKGIAASSGVIVALFDLRLVLIAAGLFFVITFTSKYVSLGSICMMVGFFIAMVCFGLAKMLPVSFDDYLIETFVMSFILAALAVFRHKENIKRLLNHTERKIGQKKEEV